MSCTVLRKGTGTRTLSPNGCQIARYSPRGHEEDPISKILAGQDHSLTESFLTKIRDALLTELIGAFFLQESVVLDSTMQGQANGTFAAFGKWLAGRLIRADANQGDIAWHIWGLGLSEKREIDLLDDFKDGVRLKE
ncbi:MAG: hypothetical protein IPL01_05775 [Acidobacteria bacterium]|nr:hypothetical protein [Acidobacteriota bacterium]